MRTGLLTVAAAVLPLVAAVDARAGPATPDTDGGALAVPGQPPGFGNPLGLGETSGGAPPGPSFGGQRPPGTGFPAGAPGSVPDEENPSALPPGGDEKR